MNTVTIHVNFNRNTKVGNEESLIIRPISLLYEHFYSEEL